MRRLAKRAISTAAAGLMGSAPRHGFAGRRTRIRNSPPASASNKTPDAGEPSEPSRSSDQISAGIA